MRALESFEAVSKFGNVTRAAEELGRTQGAVSRSVASLEEFLGQELFIRDRRQLILKDSAKDYLENIVAILDSLERDTARIIAHKREENVLRLGVLPTLAARWLMPKLGGYLNSGASTELHLVKGLGRLDFERQQVDAAIECSSEKPYGLVCHHLLDEYVVAVVSPEHYEAVGPAAYNRLIMPARPEAWELWSIRHQTPETSTSTMFENYTMMIEAACLGLGVAVVPSIYVEQDVESGKLLAPFGEQIKSGRSYWLTYSEAYSNKPKLLEFIDWLLRA